MSKEAFIGFDSAWGGHALGALAWASFIDGQAADEGTPTCACFDDVANLAVKLREGNDYVLLAVDQPIIVPNQGGSRPVERVARALMGRLKSGVQSASRSNIALFGDDASIWSFLR